MTPAEVTAKLRVFNDWRRGELSFLSMPDPREIGEAIDAAVEMIERLEAAEKSDAESIAMYRKARDERDALRAELTDLRNSMTFRTSLIGRIEAEREDLHALIAAVKKQVNAEFRLRMKKEIECNALRAEVDAMKRQEPSHWGCTVLQSDGRWKEEVSREAPPEGYFSIRDIFPLYAIPGVKGE